MRGSMTFETRHHMGKVNGQGLFTALSMVEKKHDGNIHFETGIYLKTFMAVCEQIPRHSYNRKLPIATLGYERD